MKTSSIQVLSRQSQELIGSPQNITLFLIARRIGRPVGLSPIDVSLEGISKLGTLLQMPSEKYSDDATPDNQNITALTESLNRLRAKRFTPQSQGRPACSDGCAAQGKEIDRQGSPNMRQKPMVIAGGHADR